MTESSLVDPSELAQYQAGDPALLLAHAEGLVRGYCGWHIAPSRNELMHVDGTGTRELYLPTLHLTDVFYIADNSQVIDLADIDWWHYGRVRRYDGGFGEVCWTARKQAVEVEVEHGYSSTPPDVAAVVCSLADRTIVSPTGVRSEAAGSVSITYADGATSFTSDELRVLNRYRIWNRP